jgi:hypothetical protein
MLSYNTFCSQFTNIRTRDGTGVVIPKLIRDHAHAVLASATVWISMRPVCVVYTCPIRPYPVPLYTRVHHHQYECRGRILGRNPDKILKSFPPKYSQSPLQLCIEISISSNSRNLLQFVQLLYTVKEKGRKPDRKPYPPFLWFTKSI